MSWIIFYFSHENENTKVMFFILATWNYDFDTYWGFLWKQFPIQEISNFFFFK
jgi:hypothetical protein